MNTKILPNEIRRLLNQPRQFAYLLGLAVVIALGAVLFLTVLRVQNQKSTIDRPQATNACPNCCDAMAGAGFDQCTFSDRAQCSAKQCDAAAKWQCSKTGSRCAFAGGNPDANPTCLVPNCNCGAASTEACNGGGGGGGNGGGGSVIVYIKDSNGASYGTAGTVRMTATSVCTSCNSECKDPVCSPNRERSYAGGSGSVSWSDSSKGATYNFSFSGGGSCSAPAGGSCTITVSGGGGDKTCFDTCFSKDGGNGSACTAACAKDPECVAGCTGSVSQYLACVIACANGTGGKCQQDTDCTGNKVCVDGTCTKKGQTHFECVSNACKHVAGKGTDQGGCAVVGATCGGGGGNGVDLQVSAIVVDSGAVENGIAKVHVTVQNLGTVAAGTFKVAVDKKNGSGVMDCNGNGDRSAEVTVSGVAAGASSVVDLNMPTPMGAGSFNAAAMADSGCQITETSETNNTKVTPYTTVDSTCVDSQCPKGQACFSGSCKAAHFGCTNSNVCAKLEGAGANTSGCVAAGQVCGGELGSCWGNEGVNGRCVDCNGDGVINILDFSCLACNWKEKFAPDQNPSCRGTAAEDNQ